MTFNPGSQLDPSQVTDVRGSSRIGGRGGLAVGGGGLGLVIAIIYVLLGGNPADLNGTGRAVSIGSHRGAFGRISPVRAQAPRSSA